MKFSIVCLFGFLLQSVIAWKPERARLTKISEIYLTNYPYHPGYNHDQLRCVGDDVLCKKYQVDRINCYNKDVEKGGVNWYCDYDEQSKESGIVKLNQKLNNITCRSPTEQEWEDEVFLDFCLLEYKLKLREGEPPDEKPEKIKWKPSRVRLSETKEIYLTNTAYHPGKNIHQLRCDKDAIYCDVFGKNSMKCHNKGVKNGRLDWNCDYESQDYGHVRLIQDKNNLTCQSPPDRKHDDEVYIDYCVMNYQLQWVD